MKAVHCTRAIRRLARATEKAVQSASTDIDALRSGRSYSFRPFQDHSAEVYSREQDTSYYSGCWKSCSKKLFLTTTANQQLQYHYKNMRFFVSYNQHAKYCGFTLLCPVIARVVLQSTPFYRRSLDCDFEAKKRKKANQYPNTYSLSSLFTVVITAIASPIGFQ